MLTGDTGGAADQPHRPVQISGFTIARRAVEFGYPLQESLRSLLPLVDELIVNVGDCDDGTWEAVQSIGDPKIKAFRSTWDMTKRDGLTLSEETNKAMTRCRGAWGVYLQADEVLHEAELPSLRAVIERYDGTRVEALSLLYYHFYGSYQTYKDDPRHWYRRATRIVRIGVGIESVGDACAFMVREEVGLRRPRRRDVRAHVYHYGRVRLPEQMLQKQRSFERIERMYYDDEWIAQHGLREDTNPQDLYADTRNLRVFTGTHPAVMGVRAASQNWPSPPVNERGRGLEWVRRCYVHGTWALTRGLSGLRRRA